MHRSRNLTPLSCAVPVVQWHLTLDRGRGWAGAGPLSKSTGVRATIENTGVPDFLRRLRCLQCRSSSSTLRASYLLPLPAFLTVLRCDGYGAQGTLSDEGRVCD